MSQRKMPMMSDAIAKSGNPTIALEQGRVLLEADESLLGYALHGARDLRHVLSLFTQYPLERDRPWLLDTQVRPRLTRVQLEANPECGRSVTERFFYAHHQIAQLYEQVRAVVGDQWQCTHVRLMGKSQSLLAHAEQLFGCPISLDETHCSLDFASQQLQLSLPRAEQLAPERLNRFRHYIVSQLPTQSATVEQLRLYLLRQPGELPTLEAIAESLDVNCLTLRRNLRDQQVTFQRLNQELRYYMARAYLKGSNLKLEDISHLLAYHTSANFSHAFRRWSGQSPKVWRERQRRAKLAARA